MAGDSLLSGCQHAITLFALLRAHALPVLGGRLKERPAQSIYTMVNALEAARKTRYLTGYNQGIYCMHKLLYISSYYSWLMCFIGVF